MRMKLFGSMIAVGIIAIVSSCGNKTGETTHTNEDVNPNAARISELEAQSEALLKRINNIGTDWAAAHPEITDVDALNDSLNAHTEIERMQLDKIDHELDSLKAL